MAFGKDMFDIRKQFVFYASYHNTPINVAIHLMCIWPILATLMVMLQYTPGFIETPELIKSLPYLANIKINVAFLVWAIYALCYLIMEPVAGGLANILLITIFIGTANLVALNGLVFGFPLFKAALGLHLTGWVLQFIGHGVFEGRAPALLDSLDQALLTAPLFVFLEVMFFFGYRKQFHSEMMVEVEANIKKYKDQKNKTN